MPWVQDAALMVRLAIVRNDHPLHSAKPNDFWKSVPISSMPSPANPVSSVSNAVHMITTQDVCHLASHLMALLQQL
jgi:hypothetical protein